MKKARRSKCKRAIIFLIIFLFAIDLQGVFADETEKNILIIHQYTENYPYQDKFDEGLEKVFDQETRYKINYDYEYLKLDKFPVNKAYLDATTQYFKLKNEYRNSKIDVIVTTGLVDELLWDYKEDIFGDIPMIKVPFKKCECGKVDLCLGKDGITELCGRENFDNNIELILNAQKDLKKLYIIIGSSDNEENTLKELQETATIYNGIEFKFLNELSNMKMLEEVEGADEGSAVLFIRWLEDIEGESFVTQRVLEEVIELSPVPVYGTLKHYIGTGIVGGYLYDITLLAQDVANLAIAFIDGIDPNDARELLNDYSAYVFDARAIKSWNIDKDSLPSDSVIEFKAKNVWNEYKAYIIIVLTIISLEFLLIIALIRNYKKRIRAEINLLKMNASLEKKVAMRTQELKSTIAKLEELNRELEYMSGIDPLTKLYNRRNMEELLNDARSAYIRTGNVFSVMMLDIDDFKKVNDKYGHFAGDQVLEVLANLLKESVIRYDKVARWGGEEFLLLFPGLKKESALSRAEAIRKKIEEAVCRYDCHEIPITVTIGVATIQNNETIEEVIARADESLYVGKNTGKNKVVAIPK